MITPLYVGSTIVVGLLLNIQPVFSTGKLEIKFDKYSSNGRDHKGLCCDLVCSNPCDPYFELCLTYGRDCRTVPIKTPVFEDKTNINFADSINGVTVLHTFVLPLPGYVYSIKVKITDDDPGHHDHIDTVFFNTNNIKPILNDKVGSYSEISASNSDRAKLVLKVLARCDENYYGETCTTYCKSTEHSRYTCNKTTGDKICNKGWTGRNCYEDVNECIDTAICKNGGTCLNHQGTFQCLCPPGVRGEHCEDVYDKCGINPCQNGGTCSEDDDNNIKCQCPFVWGGDRCENAVEVCASSPCLNNGICNVMSSWPGFTCSCTFHWDGNQCEEEKSGESLGDPYTITLTGTNATSDQIEEGIVDLLTKLGGITGELNVKVVILKAPINPETMVTYVQFWASRVDGPVKKHVIEDMFNTYEDFQINKYLSLPLYQPTTNEEKQEAEKEEEEEKGWEGNASWISANWFVIVIVVLVIIIVVGIIVVIIFMRRRKNYMYETRPNTNQEVLDNCEGIGYERPKRYDRQGNVYTGLRMEPRSLPEPEPEPKPDHIYCELDDYFFPRPLELQTDADDYLIPENHAGNTSKTDGVPRTRTEPES